MFRLFESIRIEGGRFCNLDLHQERVNLAFSKIYPNQASIDLHSLLGDTSIDEGVFKCRISYDNYSNEITIQPYTKSAPSTLKVLVKDNIVYDLKYEDRNALDQLFNLRAEADDILITRKGLITDTSYGNICLARKGKWYTPAQPLLAGTQRAYIIREKIVVEKDISLDDLYSYNQFMVINAMLPFDIQRAQSIDQIFE